MGRGVFAKLFVLLTLVLGVLSRPGLALAAPGPMDGLKPDASIDRSSPRRMLEGFLRAGGSGDDLRAAHYLDLRSIAPGQQPTKGAELAGELWYLMTHVGRVDVLAASDDPQAGVPKGETTLVVGTLLHRDEAVPIAIEPATFPDGERHWLFAPSTLAAVPRLFATMNRPAWETRLPPWMNETYVGNAAWQWLALVALIPVAAVLARILSALLFGAIGLARRRAGGASDTLAPPALRGAVRLGLGALLYWLAAGSLGLTELTLRVVGHVTYTLVLVACVRSTPWAASNVARWLEGRPDEGKEGIRRAIRTRAALFERLATLTATVVAIALLLLQFEAVRAAGVSVLASAGVAGVVVGFAAQRSLGAIIGGIQLSVTQPIRIGDVVAVDGEEGTIEHIFLTHVVVKRADGRHVVYPVARFLEQPFQNLSKFGSDFIALVRLGYEASRSLDELRSALRRVCEASRLWDHRLCAVDVVDLAGAQMTVCFRASAVDPLAREQLEWEIREKMAPTLRATPARASLSEALQRSERQGRQTGS